MSRPFRRVSCLNSRFHDGSTPPGRNVPITEISLDIASMPEKLYRNKNLILYKESGWGGRCNSSI